MDPVARASLVVVPPLMAVILAGVVRNRLHRFCRAFVLYAAAVALGSALVAAWPEKFYNWYFWQFKELIYGVLKFLIGLEIATLSFQAFPGARVRARQLSLVILLATLAAIALTPGDPPDPTIRTDQVAKLYLELQPRLAHGTVMFFATVWGLVLWYIIPLHRWHRAILRGLVPYMLVFTGAVRLLVSLGWQSREWVGYADSLAYLIVLSYWAWEAWRAEPPSDRPEILNRLQPWR